MRAYLEYRLSRLLERDGDGYPTGRVVLQWEFDRDPPGFEAVALDDLATLFERAGDAPPNEEPLSSVQYAAILETIASPRLRNFMEQWRTQGLI